MGERILIVEDNPMIARALNYKLNKEGYQVKVCFDGTSAIKKFKEEKFDLVLMDLVLPFNSGIKVIKWMKTEYPFIPIIVISSIDEAHIITRAFLMGVSDFISKPFNPIVLSSSIKERLKYA